MTALEEIRKDFRFNRRFVWGWSTGLLCAVVLPFALSYAAQRSGCERGVADRVDTLNVRTAQYRAASIVASDPAQPARTRAARRAEAAALLAAIRDVQPRLDPAHGGKLDCSTAPFASLLW